MPLFRKVDCLALPVGDLDESVAFYGRLGQDVIWRTSKGRLVTDATGHVTGTEL
jgi:catechol 2,3-dioxygenase-like lactoylglutathione lyase family enzyme